MKVTKEMQLLRDKLDEMGVKYMPYNDRFGNLTITRTWFFDNAGVKWSVIHGFGTMGGYDGIRADGGLLEIWNYRDDPIGYLTAKEALNIIFKR